MKRTQVYLPEETHRQLHQLAQVGGESFSELVRQGVEMVIQKKQQKNDKTLSKPLLPTFKSGKKLKKLTREDVYETF